MDKQDKSFRVAIDVGGTFTDAVELNEVDGKIRTAKVPTTPDDPTKGFIDVLNKLGTPLPQVSMILHGTTLGVNAVIQLKGAHTGIITNKGFGDVFEIGRGDVVPFAMYDYNYEKPQSLIKRRDVMEISCRIDKDGKVIEELDPDIAEKGIRKLVEFNRVQSVAVMFLNSYRNTSHEEHVKELIRKMYPQIYVSISSDLVREYREYERLSTAVLDAYIKPLVSRYLNNLKEALYKRGFNGLLMLMRPDGGTMPIAYVSEKPILTISSGPAGGVRGAVHIANLLGRENIIAMDIGGTTLLTCLIENYRPNAIHQIHVNNYPALITAYDVRAIGAGGGSVARIANGLLQVGPESAAADPGPLCYNKGGKYPTLTDAFVVLGYIDPNTFLAGDMHIMPSLSIEGILRQIGNQLGIELIEAAAGIVRVDVANGLSALRQITIEEGRDPSDYSLLAYGGGGPILASILAHELGVSEVIIPFAPSNFSAWGMLVSDITYESSMTNFGILDNMTIKDIDSVFKPLETEASIKLLSGDVPFQQIVVEKALEMRYLGQEHVLEVPLNNFNQIHDLRVAFDRMHSVRYGHSMNNPVEIVNYRVKVIGKLRSPVLQIHDKPTHTAPDPIGYRKAFCLIDERVLNFPVYSRRLLTYGQKVRGPAIIDEGVTSTVVHSTQSAQIDQFGNIVVSC